MGKYRIDSIIGKVKLIQISINSIVPTALIADFIVKNKMSNPVKPTMPSTNFFTGISLSFAANCSKTKKTRMGCNRSSITILKVNVPEKNWTNAVNFKLSITIFLK